MDAADMDEDKVVGGKEFSPPGLPAVEDLGGHEGFKILVIREDLNRVASPFEVVPPVPHAFDDGEHFPVGDIVVAFCRGAFAGEVGNRVPG
jgi:hypothetical protein